MSQASCSTPQSNDVNSQILLSPSAVEKISAIMKEEGYGEYMFRVAVVGGGCSGFRYDLSFDDHQEDDDIVYDYQGIKVVTDEVSLEFLAGATVDYVEDMMGASFRIQNPNAKSSCGCGNSFAT